MIPTAPITAAETTAPTRRAQSFYRPELDALRFLAFLCVFYHHTIPRYTAAYGVPFPLAHVLCCIADAGGLGLCLFFTLSAYLICELLLREKYRTGTIIMKRFYIRRLLRIWPLYILGLTLGAVWDLHFGVFRNDLPWFVSFLFMTGNIYTGLYGWGGIAGGPAGPLWSISIEEQFYLFWPLLAKLGSEKLLHWFAWGLIFLANLTLLYLGLRHVSTDLVVWTNSLVQFYMFGAGILLCLYLKGRMPQISVPLRLLLAAGSFGAWFTAAFVFHVKDRSAFSTVSYVVPGYALIAAGCIGLMLAFMGIQRVPGWLSYLGRISYGLYVFHEFAIRELAAHRWQHIAKKHNLPDNTLITFSVALLGSLLLAALSYRYFEAPFRRLKDKEAVIHSQPATALVE